MFSSFNIIALVTDGKLTFKLVYGGRLFFSNKKISPGSKQGTHVGGLLERNKIKLLFNGKINQSF